MTLYDPNDISKAAKGVALYGFCLFRGDRLSFVKKHDKMKLSEKII